MRLVLLLFSVSVLPSHLLKLPKHRESCKNDWILIESSNFDWKTRIDIDFPVGNTWQEAIDEECKNRNKRSILSELPSRQFYRGFSIDDVPKREAVNNVTTARKHIRSLLKDHIVHPTLLDAINPIVRESRKLNLEPIIRLGGKVKFAKCFASHQGFTKHLLIKATVQVMQPDVLQVWRCEDIGRAVNNTYRYYEMPTEFMFDALNEITFKVDKTACLAAKRNRLFCQPKAFRRADCSKNNVEKCTEVVKSMDHSPIIRNLTEGIAIYGAFRRMAMLDMSKEFMIDPGLYFFSFKTGNTSCPDGRRI
ncbi:unnamed protein product [Caenorhabditis sp. 36 PRJEB53466]|nr:unnamed protein product [Caenorhabditis sp. 36 PRJEB53466]